METVLPLYVVVGHVRWGSASLPLETETKWLQAKQSTFDHINSTYGFTQHGLTLTDIQKAYAESVCMVVSATSAKNLIDVVEAGGIEIFLPALETTILWDTQPEGT